MAALLHVAPERSAMNFRDTLHLQTTGMNFLERNACHGSDKIKEATMDRNTIIAAVVLFFATFAILTPRERGLVFTP
jgi:hypothetical protein